MFRAIRFRLALWYTVVLGVCLVGFAGLTWVYIDRAINRRIDDSLREVAQAFVAAWHSAQSSTPNRKVSAAEVVQEFRADEFELVIFDEAQREVASNSRTTRVRRPRRARASPPTTQALLPRPDLAPLFREAGAGGEAFATLDGPSGLERAYAVDVTLPGRREVVAVIQDLASRRQLIDDLGQAFLLMAPIGLLVAFGGGVFLAGRALDPVGAMADQADAIEASTLHERLSVANPRDELGHLATVVNRLLGRLEAAFDQQRRFMTEAAHELRTPVAVVRGEADLALSRAARPEDQYREALDVIRDESRRMTRIVDDLFLLGRADANAYPLTIAPIELGAVARDAVRSEETIAAAREIAVVCEAPDPLPLEGDESLIRRALQNLLDNAVKYGRRGGHVWVDARRDDGHYRVLVRDDGPGIPPEEQARIFDRFYRGASARAAGDSDNGSGAGLGLAVARWVAGVHQGSLELVRSDSTGTEFELRVPAPTSSPSPV